MKKIYHGSCHCGAVTYEASLDLSAGTFRCNCSICRKKRNWLAVAAPEDFHLTGGADNIAFVPFVAPKVARPETAHFIVKVTDKGSPPLTRYKRVIVTILP